MLVMMRKHQWHGAGHNKDTMLIIYIGDTLQLGKSYHLTAKFICGNDTCWPYQQKREQI